MDDRGTKDHLTSLIIKRTKLYDQRTSVQQQMLAAGVSDTTLYRLLAESKTIADEINYLDREIDAAEALLGRP